MCYAQNLGLSSQECTENDTWWHTSTTMIVYLFGEHMQSYLKSNKWRRIIHSKRA